MIEMLELETLQHIYRRSIYSICPIVFFLFKVVEGLFPAFNPEDYLKSQKPKRRIRYQKVYLNYKCANLVENIY